MAKYLRILAIIVLSIAIIVSCTAFGTKATDAATYSHTIEVLDKNRTTVLGLSAASAAASAAVSVLPNDICSPISEQLSEFTSWFMMILGFIYLEKYLLTILGGAACYILFPIGCGILLTHCFFPKPNLKSMGIKLVAFGLVVLLAVPASIMISDEINSIYSKSIELTVQSADAVSDNLIGDVATGDQGGTSVIDEAKTLLDDMTTSVAGVIEQFKNVLNRFIEATAVMVVTTCLIPILVILFFIWVVKTLFNIPIVVPTQMLKPRKAKGLKEREESKELMIAEE